MEGQYNTRSPAVKRLMREAMELKEATSDYFAQPLSDNLFEWHFTVRGPCDTEFEGGVYHGRIILPTDYPMKPPHIMVLTPNGRFETGKKICLSISGHHPESWQPSWSIRTALLAIIGFMPTPGQGTIGSLDYPKSERVKLAKKSTSFVCPECSEGGQPAAQLLLTPDPEAPSITEDADLKKIVSNAGVAKAPIEEEKPVSKKEAFARKRKEASLAMQAKFREKLMARTPELVKQVQQSKNRPPAASTPLAPTSASPAARTPAANTPRQSVAPAGGVAQRQEDRRNIDGGDVGGGHLVEVLVGLIVVVVAAVLYRRSAFFQKLLFGDDDDVGEVDQLF